jgi:O-antigen ligase
MVALLAAGCVCLFLTYTRSGWIGFGLAVLVMGALRHRKLILAAPVLLVAAAIALPGATDKVQKRFGDLTSQSEAASENSWSWRTGQWRKMLPYGTDKPLTGEGFGRYSELTVKRFGYQDRQYPTIVVDSEGHLSKGFSAHNDYVKMFVELGVPGLVLWTAVLVGMLSVALAARRVPELAGPAAAVAAIAAMLMAVSVSDNVQGYSVVLAAAFAVCGGLAGAARGLARREPAPLADTVGPTPERVELQEASALEAPAEPEEAAEAHEPAAQRAAKPPRRSGGLVGTAAGLLRGWRGRSRA